MKGWNDPAGLRELPGIQRDMEKIRRTPWPGAILITTRNRKHQTEENLVWLAEHLGIHRQEFRVYTLDTAGRTAEEGQWEFIVAGFLVAGALAA